MATWTVVIAIVCGFNCVHARVLPTSESTPSRSPECYSCKGKSCIPVVITKLEDGACRCGRRMVGHTMYADGHLRVRRSQNDTLTISWRMSSQIHSGSVLILPTVKGDLCMKIILPKIPTWLSDVPVHVKVICTNRDLVFMDDEMLRLVDWNNFQNIAVSKRKRKTKRKNKKRTNEKPSRSYGRRKTGLTASHCDCHPPDTVRVRQVDESTLEVGWEPFMADRDLRVRVVQAGHRTSEVGKDITIPWHRLCKVMDKNQTFSNFASGFYVASVAVEGCTCGGFTDSSPFHLKESVQDTSARFPTTLMMFRVEDEEEEVWGMFISIIAVGALAVLGCGAIGLVCLAHMGVIKCNCQKRKIYHFVQPTKAFPRIAVAEDMKDAASREVSKWIYEQLSQSDRKVDMITSDQLETETNTYDLIILVSLKDVNTYQIPEVGPVIVNRTINVLVDYTISHNHLLARCPEGIDMLQQGLQGLNNGEKRMRDVELLYVMKLLCQHIDKRIEEHFIQMSSHIVDNRKQLIKKIFLISGNDNSCHDVSCRELARLLRMLDKTVSCTSEDLDTHDLQQPAGPLISVLSQMSSADLVLVVASDHLANQVNYYNEKHMSISNNEMLCLKLLENQIIRSEVCFVTFGNGHKSMDMILQMYPLLSKGSIRYDLTNAVNLNIDKQDTGHAPLRRFFSSLSADQALVNIAMSEAGAFLKNTENNV